MADLDRIHDKLDILDEKLNSIDKTLAEQHITLKEHMRRSEANEKSVELLKSELKPIIFQSHIIKLITKVIFGILGSGTVIEIMHFLLK